MKIKDCQTLPEFFGVKVGGCIWVEGHEFTVRSLGLASDDLSYQDDARALVGCLSGQLEWSTEESKEEEFPFGHCEGCGYEFNSELIDEYKIEYCPKCGRRIKETILMAPTLEEEKLLREIAAWFPTWDLIDLKYQQEIRVVRWDDPETYPFSFYYNSSKAYSVLAPILHKCGAIDLNNYRKV